jgi:dTMP kinase
MLIVLEGIDGAGKSTQQQRLAAWLAARGQSVVTCRDPGSTALGDRIRNLVLHQHDIAVDPLSEMLLFMAARCQLVREVIGPALQRGAWVVCDRFQMSTVVYQGHAGRVDLESIRSAGAIATGGLVPELTIVFDLDEVSARSRIGRHLDRLESRDDEYWRAVREGFLTEARRDPQRVEVVDASLAVDEITRRITAMIDRRFSGGGSELGREYGP